MAIFQLYTCLIVVVSLPDKVSIGLYFYFIFLFICGKFHSRLFDSCGKVLLIVKAASHLIVPHTFYRSNSW